MKRAASQLQHREAGVPGGGGAAGPALAGCLAIEGKKVQTTSPLPEDRAYLASLYEFVGDKPKALEKIVEAYTYSVTDKRWSG